MDVAIRDAMVAAAGGGPGESFHVLREAGARGLEVQVDPDFTTPHLRQPEGSPYSLSDAGGVRALERRLGAERVVPDALLVNTDFSGPNADARVEWAARVVRIAKDLGCPVVRIDPLARDKKVGLDAARANFIRCTRRLLDRTADTGVDLGVENHGFHANDPAFLDALFAELPDPRLGLTLDTGNFYWFGFPLSELYSLLERYAPRAKHTHVKNINYPKDLADVRRPIGQDYGKYCCALDEGNIDLRRVVGILRRAGYTRSLCAENEALGKAPRGERVEVLRRDVRALKAAMAP
jgi:sugar phosphate isomerase/epimerase